MKINKDNIQIVNELKIGDIVQILDYQFEVMKDYFLALRNAKNYENNGTIFIKLGIDSAKFSRNILGYYEGGAFPECRTLADLTKLVKALFVEAEKQERQKKEKQPIYKWAQGDGAINLLEKEGGENITNWENNNKGFFYMPCNGGVIEYLTPSEIAQNKYIKSHGIEIKPVEILDEVEKKYLGDVIRPWRCRIVDITKHIYMDNHYEFLQFRLERKSGKIDYSALPIFPSGTMYKGMKLKRKYTLEELGL